MLIVSMDTTTDDTLTDYTDHPDDYDYPGDDLDILPLSSLVPAVVLVYLVSDFTMCSLSVLLVILISQDQLLILRKGALYATTETKPKAYVKIALAWILGFLLYGPAIIGWDHWGQVTLPLRVTLDMVSA
nr:hypothetical protein BaRGS_004589 [Batillaria attramentaria]